MGRRYLRLLAAVFPEHEVGVWRQSRADVPPEWDESAAGIMFHLDEVLDFAPDAAIIASPASSHIETGRVLASAGVHLLVEKPISDTRAGVEDLLRACLEGGLTLMVGYQLRYAPVLKAVRALLDEDVVGRVLHVRAEVGQHLADWRPGKDHLGSVSALRSRGGGALLELSHELDYLRWLFGEVKDVLAVVRRLGDVTVDTEDCADLLLDLASGVVANVHLDMLQRPPVRTGKVVGADGTLTFDLVAGEVRAHDAHNGWRLIDVPEGERDSMHTHMIADFFTAVRDGSPPPVTGEDGLRALEIVEAARQSARAGSRVRL